MEAASRIQPSGPPFGATPPGLPRTAGQRVAPPGRGGRCGGFAGAAGRGRGAARGRGVVPRGVAR